VLRSEALLRSTWTLWPGTLETDFFNSLLELTQTLTPDRHGTLIDALEKMAGGAIGIMLTKIAQRKWQAERFGA